MQLKSKPEILRSYSHPGCLKNTDREPVENKPSTPKKCVGQRTKRVDKKLYSKSIYVVIVDLRLNSFKWKYKTARLQALINMLT